MIIAMHYSEGGKHDTVSDFIGTPDDPLYSLKLTNMFYSGNCITRCQENENAKKDIEKFLGLLWKSCCVTTKLCNYYTHGIIVNWICI